VYAHLFEYDNREYGVSTVRDVSEREKLVQELKTSQQQYQEVVDRVDVGVGLADADERFVFANAVAEDIYGVPRGMLAGRSLSEFVDPEQFAQFRRQTQRRIQGESENYEADIIRLDGQRRTIRVAASPRFSEDGVFEGTFGLFRDVTDERRLAEERNAMEDRLRRAERMESIGLMAGGVAHDLNNMFSPIIGYPELILGVLPPDSKAIKWVKQMATAAESAADVIADLLTLARRGRYQMKPTDVNLVLKEYADSPAYTRVLDRNPGIAFTLNLDPSVGHITGSATHLTKTFMNIITNAFEASSAGGSVSVTTNQQYLKRLPSGHDDVIAGEYVVVRVIDTGTGIPQEDIAKVFEPYFSRKKMGASGSGLGLSVVYGVVKDHHGYYDIQSEVGKGTEFALYFPVMSETADDDTFTATSEGRSFPAPTA
jgi:PAS domain S-box-containing protein